MTRKYDMKRRAERQEETRRRIVEATVALHETVGMTRTTISAVAAQAGVQRLTVYRHFPDERALFIACTEHYMADNFPPDPTSWTQIADPEERLRHALTVIYAYHRRTEPMFSNVIREAPVMPLVREMAVPYFEHWGRVRDGLAADWDAQDDRLALLLAALGHALDFQTWQSLARRQALDDAQAVEVMVRMVRCTLRD